MNESPSLEANSCSDGQEILRLLWNTKVDFRFHKSPPLILILSEVRSAV
jgi:hypothetical protein